MCNILRVRQTKSWELATGDIFLTLIGQFAPVITMEAASDKKGHTEAVEMYECAQLSRYCLPFIQNSLSPLLPPLLLTVTSLVMCGLTFRPCSAENHWKFSFFTAA